MIRLYFSIRIIIFAISSLGGFSLGHISFRASQMNSTSEKIGWADLIVTLRQSAAELKINYTGEQGNQTHLNDPFTQGINMTVLVDTLIDNMETKENVKVGFEFNLKFPICNDMIEFLCYTFIIFVTLCTYHAITLKLPLKPFTMKKISGVVQ